MIRCQSNLCNNGPGDENDNTGGNGGGGGGSGSITVNGRSWATEMVPNFYTMIFTWMFHPLLSAAQLPR